jgi:hypothetical protein
VSPGIIRSAPFMTYSEEEKDEEEKEEEEKEEEEEKKWALERREERVGEETKG